MLKTDIEHLFATNEQTDRFLEIKHLVTEDTLIVLARRLFRVIGRVPLCGLTFGAMSACDVAGCIREIVCGRPECNVESLALRIEDPEKVGIRREAERLNPG